MTDFLAEYSFTAPNKGEGIRMNHLYGVYLTEFVNKLGIDALSNRVISVTYIYNEYFYQNI